MKLAIIGLSGVLLLTGCSSSVENKSSSSVESACERVREGFSAFSDPMISSEEMQVRKAIIYFDQAIPIFRELSVSNPLFGEYVEQLNGFKSTYLSYAKSDAKPVEAFCR